jgi:uncharacterized protein (DUF1778 family)
MPRTRSTASTTAAAKEDRLYIRVSPAEKATLTQAAQRRHLNASQFVLQASLDAAHAVLAENNIVRLSPDAYDAFVRRLDEPARDIPELSALFAERLLFDSPNG